MGCSCSNKSVNAYRTSFKESRHCEEVEEIAELPARAMNEDFDLVTIVELSVKCTNLFSAEKHSVDPIVFFLVEDENIFEYKDRSEILSETLDPEFITTFKIAYSFEKNLRFKLDVYDNKKITSNPLNKAALIGSAVFNIHEIVSSVTHSISKPLANPLLNRKNLGNISVHSEEVNSTHDEVEISWRFSGATAKGGYVLKVSRNSDSEFIPVFQTESSEFKGSNPVEWKTINIYLYKICKGNLSLPIKIEVFHVHKGLKLFGACFFTINELKSGVKEKPLLLNSEVCGTLTASYFQYLEKYTFLQYVTGGCEISLIIGIDFTKSNGDPSNDFSLHNTSPNSQNEYISAIKEVGEILQYYDSDKKIPVYGFGAKLPPHFDHVCHCFALNKNIFSPDVTGIEEVLESYSSILNDIHFHGPTHFSEIINKSLRYASSVTISQKSQHYYILLIITDGIVNDIDDTIDAIVLACDYPISIIIVGVGLEDFSIMHMLDADKNPIFSKKYNKNAARDVVQFVPFKEFKGKNYALAREVLFEIPSQVMEYMSLKAIKPNPVLKSFNTVKNNNRAQANEGDDFLKGDQETICEELIRLGFQKKIVDEVIGQGVLCDDIEYVKNLMEERKRTQYRPRSILKKSQTSGNKVVVVGDMKKFCTICQTNSINIVLEDCGCEIVCSKCVKIIGKLCSFCGYPITRWRLIDSVY